MTSMHWGGNLRPLTYCETRTADTAAEIGSHQLNALRESNFCSTRTQTRQRRCQSAGADPDPSRRIAFCMIAIRKIGHSKRNGIRMRHQEKPPHSKRARYQSWGMIALWRTP